MTTSTRHRGTRGARALLLATAASVVALLALGAGSAAAAPAALQKATGSCWQEVLNDWLAHEPNVVGSYAIPCYTQAIQHLDNYPDIQQYSNAPDDIRRALLAALRNNHGGGPGGGSGNGVGPTSGPPGPRDPQGGSSGGIITRFFHNFGPSDAQSVPLPLLVLGGLAVLLLLAAAATWFAKRLQTRRMTPAPARAAAPPKQS